jgi:hypothetical protein
MVDGVFVARDNAAQRPYFSQERENKCSNLSSGQWHACPTGASTFQKNDRHLADGRGRTSHTNMTPPGPLERMTCVGCLDNYSSFKWSVSANILLLATVESTVNVVACQSHSCSEIGTAVVATCSGSINAVNLTRRLASWDLMCKASVKTALLRQT